MLRRDLITGVATALLSGCGGGPRRATPWPSALTMGTGSAGGTYAAFGPAWGSVVQATTGINVGYRVTQGPNQNILLLDRGSIQLGMATLGIARQAWEGSGDWTQGTRLRGIRALFPMYNAPFHGIALASSGIVRLAQLGGRTVGAGETGGTAGVYLPAMLAALGIRPRAIRFGGIAEQTGQVLDGSLDALVLAAGAPIPSFADAEQRADLHILGVTAREASRLRASLPELSPGVLPRGTYRSLRGDLPIVGMFSFTLCRSDLPDDLAEAITAGVFDHHAEMVAKAPVAAETLAANVTHNTVVPFHPGAVAYYQRVGIDVPNGPDLA